MLRSMGNTEPARSMGHNISSLEILKLLSPFGMRKNCNAGAKCLLFYLLLEFNHDSDKTYCSYYRRKSLLSTTQGSLRQL